MPTISFLQHDRSILDTQQNDHSIGFSDKLVCHNKPSKTYCLFLQCEPFKRKKDYKRNWHTGKEYIILCMNLTNLILSYYYGSNLKLYIKVGVSFKRIHILKKKVVAVDKLVLRIWEIKRAVVKYWEKSNWNCMH